MTRRPWNVSRRVKLSDTWRGFKSPLNLFGFRVLAVATMFFALRYLGWRYTSSLNFDALWFALPLVLAETYSILNVGLFVINLWRPTTRKPPDLTRNYTVDVFITTYNEPAEIVYRTAEAAKRINHPHKTYILDDGRSEQIKAIAEKFDIGYICRSDNRHAKAGNINNALQVTEGDLILYLDADQIPSPRILDKVLGYFEDERVAFVQTPQHFYNIPDSDPFGNDADLFYGPIQQGKDGWDSAFLCGTNVVLRREALIQMGLIYYVQDMQEELTRTLHATNRAAVQALEILEEETDTEVLVPARIKLENTQKIIRQCQEDLKLGAPLNDVFSTIRNAGDSLSRLIQTLSQSKENMAAILRDLDGMASISSEQTEVTSGARTRIESDVVPSIDRLEAALRVLQNAAEEVGRVVDIEEQPMATISITEDLATSVRLHALGWKSVFHSDVLARGLAPEDLHTTIKQRSRWAQGTLQVMIKDNPIFKVGLSFMQRLQYFTTIFSYFYGFAALIYLIAPVIPLVTGITPVQAYSMGFFMRLLPYLVLNQLMFVYATRGLSTWRGQQYQLALFPVWIGAFLKVFFKRDLKFEVTPKERQKGIFLNLIKLQLSMIVMNVVAIAYGIFIIKTGKSAGSTSILINIFWSFYNMLMLSSIVRGAIWRPVQEKDHSASYLSRFSESPIELVGGYNYAGNDRGNHSKPHSHIAVGRHPQRTHRAVIEAANQQHH